MNNMEIYEKYQSVPQAAQKTIVGGRLKGMTDINPMWRIRSLTELFGACGVGWYTTIDRTWNDDVAGEVVTNVEISLYIKVDGEWSKPIKGIGGSKILSKEKSGGYVSDEAYKMAYTDAISVACKALGFGADVYWANGRTKYNQSAPQADTTWRDKIRNYVADNELDFNEFAAEHNLTRNTTEEQFKALYQLLTKKED